jgi:endoglucanase
VSARFLFGHAMNRRQFLQATAAAALSLTSSTVLAAPATQPIVSTVNKLPRWRGFNLLEMFNVDHVSDYKEPDFAMLADWGFDFVRLPASYLCWSSKADWNQMREEPLKNLDRAVALGQAHGIHVNLNLHRLPGYCVNPPKEPADLWADPGALDAAAHQWSELARRFKDIPSSALSFDLINEPADIHVDAYVKVISRLVGAIRAQSRDRLIIADGLKWGTTPVPELANLNIAQGTRGYAPLQISHYKANWIKGNENWALPTWPLVLEKETWSKDRLNREQTPWRKLQQQGVGVHVGEWGAFNHTPHDVAMAWMRDSLELWKSNGWGWSLWNLRGSFGILNSGRKDVAYESYQGHQLDKAMLELLREY